MGDSLYAGTFMDEEVYSGTYMIDRLSEVANKWHESFYELAEEYKTWRNADPKATELWHIAQDISDERQNDAWMMSCKLLDKWVLTREIEKMYRRQYKMDYIAVLELRLSKNSNVDYKAVHRAWDDWVLADVKRRWARTLAETDLGRELGDEAWDWLCKESEKFFLQLEIEYDDFKYHCVEG